MRLISKKKIDEFRAKLSEQKIEQMILLCSDQAHDMNLEYLTGLRQSRRMPNSCLIYSKGKFTLIVSPLEYEQASKEAEVDEIIELKMWSLKEIFKKKLKAGSAIGVNTSSLPYGAAKLFPRCKLKSVSKVFYGLRSVKEPKEIEMIEKACKITNLGVNFLEENLSAKVTEKNLVLELEDFLKRKGAEDMAFDTILTSGKRSSLIHPYPSSSGKKLGSGLGLVDFGVIYGGYCSDITVPFSIGRLCEKEKRIVSAVERAYEATIGSLKSGVESREVSGIAQDSIQGDGFDLVHAIGHGIGLDEHDSPVLFSKPRDGKLPKKHNETILQENMVLAIEPGIYVPGIGGCRLENDFLITKKWARRLTNARLISIGN
jgi:Xaa-Pro aminopeptidase